MSSIAMIDARSGQGKAEQTKGEEVGVATILAHKSVC